MGLVCLLAWLTRGSFRGWRCRDVNWQPHCCELTRPGPAPWASAQQPRCAREATGQALRWKSGHHWSHEARGQSQDSGPSEVTGLYEAGRDVRTEHMSRETAWRACRRPGSEAWPGAGRSSLGPRGDTQVPCAVAGRGMGIRPSGPAFTAGTLSETAAKMRPVPRPARTLGASHVHLAWVLPRQLAPTHLPGLHHRQAQVRPLPAGPAPSGCHGNRRPARQAGCMRLCPALKGTGTRPV